MSDKLNSKQVKQLLNGLESQGCAIKEIPDGYRIVPPNGGKIMTLHLTLSDTHRGMLNLRAEARRLGLRWPFDGGGKRKGKK